MKHSLAVVGLLLALYCTLPAEAIENPCVKLFNVAKDVCERKSGNSEDCAEINKGIDAFTQLLQDGKSGLCTFPSPFWFLCKLCKDSGSGSGSSKLADAGNGTASDVADAAPPAVRSGNQH